MRILITGGAGFIGSNLAAKCLRLGDDVVVLDNLSRPGSRNNLDWLRSIGQFDLIEADVRDFPSLLKAFASKEFDAVFHQAAQVAVTRSVENPRIDFEINALGTFNLLEAIRHSRQNPVFVYASTNKVYGSLSSLRAVEQNGHYILDALPSGIPETMPLDLLSPYGCSKGAADQYVLDYRRIYGLRTVVFRQSCIYGPRQMGLEDQGWIAWFGICGVLGRPITIYGDGKQVRDVLYIDDLVDLYCRAIEVEPNLGSYVFNVGGGPTQAISLLELIGLIGERLGYSLDVNFSEWRPGDQRVYVSDIRAISSAFAWTPRVSVLRGVSALLEWITQHRDLFIETV